MKKYDFRAQGAVLGALTGLGFTSCSAHAEPTSCVVRMRPCAEVAVFRGRLLTGHKPLSEMVSGSLSCIHSLEIPDMNFSERQADPRLHRVGNMFATLPHVFAISPIAAGVGKKVVEAARKLPPACSGAPELTGSAACTMMC